MFKFQNKYKEDRNPIHECYKSIMEKQHNGEISKPHISQTYITNSRLAHDPTSSMNHMNVSINIDIKIFMDLWWLEVGKGEETGESEFQESLEWKAIEEQL